MEGSYPGKSLGPPLLGSTDNSYLNRRLRRHYGRDFHHGHKSFIPLLWPVWLAPGIAALRLWMAGQIKDFGLPTPDGLTGEHLMHRHAFAPDSAALVQFLNRDLQPVRVFALIRHRLQ